MHWCWFNALNRQPLLDALPACGSENCIVLLCDLMTNKELEEEQAHTFLTTIALIPHPSPRIINSINVGTSEGHSWWYKSAIKATLLNLELYQSNYCCQRFCKEMYTDNDFWQASACLVYLHQVLLEFPEVQSKVLLSGSSLVYQLCQRSQISCSELPQVQTFIKILEETLKESCKEENPTRGQTVGVLHVVYWHWTRSCDVKMLDNV